ncbi:MAG TPA: hypothetical protein DCZ75_01920 [Geobacter sp.]|nr:hypothetical protein [Geobacter sp.]
MKQTTRPSQLFSHPLTIFGTLLLVTFTTETAVMSVLTFMFPTLAGFSATLTDAFFLTMLSAPMVWLLIARPLRRMALAESAKADTLLRSIADAVISFDANGSIKSLNPAAEKIFGYPPHEIEGRNIEELLPELPHLWSRSGAPSPDASLSSPSPEEETIGRHRDGSTLSMEVSLGLLDAEDCSTFIAVIHDITHRKRAAALVEEQREFLESLLQQSAVPIFVVSPEHRVLIWNRACEQLTGKSAQEMLGTQDAWKAFYPERRPVLADIVLSGDLQAAREGYGSCIPSGFIPEGLQSEGWYRDLNGRDRYIVFDAAPIRNSRGDLLAVIESLEEITQRKLYEEQLEYQASYDTLTGLINRNLLADRMRQALLISRRSRHEVAVFLLDLDDFQMINDTVGQDGGDSLLKMVAERLSGCVRGGDTVARQGADEFVVIVSDPALSDSAPVIAANIQETIARPMRVKGQEVIVTASIGISISPKDGEDVQTLFRNAEVALYRAKEQGRHSFQFYTAEMNARSLARMTLEKHLRRALERDELSVHYQPKVSMSSGMVTGLEALVRWQSPELGSIPPDSFIPLAEETGLILSIGAWVLKTACAQNKAWQEAGLPLLTVAVNLSPRQFRQQNIASLVADCLNQTGLDPRFLELEITESMVMQEVTRVASVLAELKQMGVSLAMDDFGTGYSSLGYLKRFPFDKLKIDKSFIKDITFEPNNAAIAKAVIAMAHSLHLKVIAEGVETQGQLNYLHAQGCDEIQGYFFSRPVPAVEVEQLLREGGRISIPSHAEGCPGKTVLVVDDDEDVLSALQRMLLLEGYFVLVAQSAQEGFEQLALNKVAVIISDFRMPIMDGTDFLGRAKELYPETVRILLSGYADLDAVTHAVNVGAIYKFLCKPWIEADLREQLADAFGHYAQLYGKK